jgi:hypothetical protein
VRRTPVYDPFDDHDDPSHDPGPNVRRIVTTPGAQRGPRRAEVRPLHASRRPPPRRGPDPRVWFIRGAIGVAALAGLWLGLQALFPVSESRVSQAPTPAQPIDASAVGAPEPPITQAVAQQPVPTPIAQAAPAPEGDRLPGLPTPDAAAAAQAAPSVAQAAPPAVQPAPPAAQAAPTEAQPAPAEAAVAPPAQPAAQPRPQEESPVQQPVGTPTLEPIPPPPGAQAAQPPRQPAPPAAAAPKPQAAPPAAASNGGPFELAASASPVNPISEQANVTITVRATQGGAPLAGAACMATVYYRTNTVKQPNGGFRTNANGVGSFTLDARNTTYGFYIPVDVTCSGRGGTVTARTGFTPVKGR